MAGRDGWGRSLETALGGSPWNVSRNHKPSWALGPPPVNICIEGTFLTKLKRPSRFLPENILRCPGPTSGASWLRLLPEKRQRSIFWPTFSRITSLHCSGEKRASTDPMVPATGARKRLPLVGWLVLVASDLVQVVLVIHFRNGFPSAAHFPP